MISVDSALMALATAGLPGAPQPLRSGWADRLEDVGAHGLNGMLAWTAVDGRVEIDGPTADDLLRRLEDEAREARLAEAELLRLGPLLRGLPILVTGALQLAHEAYPEPRLRPIGPLSFLVPAHSVEDAAGALASAGYERTPPGLARPEDASDASVIVLHHPSGGVVNLSHTLPGGALLDVDALLVHHRTLTLGSATFAATPWEALLVACALEAAHGPDLGRALAIRDVAQVALRPKLDVRSAISLARRCDAIDVLASALDPWREEELSGPVEPWLESRFDELRHPRATFARMPAVSAITRALATNDAGRPEETVLRRDRAPGGPLGSPSVLTVPRPPIPASRARRDAGRAPSGGGPEIGEEAPRRHPRARSAQPGRLKAAPLPESVAHPTVGLSTQERWSHARARRSDLVPAASGLGNGPGGIDHGAGAAPPGPVEDEGTSPTGEPAPPVAHEVRWAVAGVAVLVVNIFTTQLGAANAGVVLVPLAGFLLAVAAARHITRRHPDEAWVGRWLLIGVAVKIAASYFRYYTLVVSYKGGGDATGYDDYGKRFVLAWTAMGPDINLENLKASNFLRWFTGIVYYLFGTNMVCGFFVYGLLALVGSYLWYRAAVHALPAVDKRLCLGLLFFAPSIAFWPSSIGKEALMQLGIGAIALGAAFIFRKELVRGLLIGLPGGWLVWVVRPHLLALVALSATCAFAIGRVRGADQGLRSLLGRPIGLLVMAVALAFSISQATRFLGVDGLSISTIETELEEQTERSAQGGSQFDPGGNYLNPLNLPRGMATVLLRPFPWETDSSIQLLASLESALLVGLIISRLPSLRFAISRARTIPFLLFCLLMTTLYSATYSAIANFGLLVRQRSLVLPAVYVLISVLPRDRHAEELETELTERPAAADARR